MDYEINDITLAEDGKARIEWAERFMPVIQSIRRRFLLKKPLRGIRIAADIDITAESAVFMRTLTAGGAHVMVVRADNAHTIQDDTAASLVKHYKIPVFALHKNATHADYTHIHKVLDTKPNIIIDSGSGLTTFIHKSRKDILEYITGGVEETTTGVRRARAMEYAHALKYPVIAINDSRTKYIFDNKHGTGQAAIDGILRATNILFAGAIVVIAGYGWCGRGFAQCARGFGAHVIITETNPITALEAHADGFEVLPMMDAVKKGTVFITATGNKHVLTADHFRKMKNGAIIGNIGHSDVEIDIPALQKITKNTRQMRRNVIQYSLGTRKLYVIGNGQILNQIAAEGHPAAVMDISFANQAFSIEYLKRYASKLERKVYSVPVDIDENIALMKLNACGVAIDAVTRVQKKYLADWQ